MKLTVITVCYNAEKNIEKTLNSLFKQSFKDYELIIIDGKSTDQTLEIIKKYKNKINVLISEKDTGIYNAMNKGILLSKGEFLLFLNAADYLYNEFTLSKIFENEYFNEDILYGDVIINYPNGEKVRARKKKLGYFRLINSVLWHQAAFIKRKLFFDYGLYDEKFKICAEYEFFLRVLIKYNCSKKYLPLVFSNYDAGGLSSGFDVWENILEEQKKARQLNCSFYVYYLFCIYRFPIYFIAKNQNIFFIKQFIILIKKQRFRLRKILEWFLL